MTRLRRECDTERACDVKINREWEQNTNCDILPTLRLTFPQATEPREGGFLCLSEGGGRSCGVCGSETWA